jgi:hypothetical protein
MPKVTGVEVLHTVFGGPGPGGMLWRVVRLLPMREVWRIDFVVTDGRADPQLTKLDPARWREQVDVQR